MAKTVFHSELVKLSPVKVTVKTAVMKSKFAGKPDYVVLLIGGEERTYTTENPTCADFFREAKGRTFSLVAEGREAEATLTYVGEELPETAAPAAKAAAPPPAKAAAATPPPRNPPVGAPPPAAAGAPPPAERPAARIPTDVERVAAARKHAFKIAQVGLISRRAAHWVSTIREQEGEVMSSDQVAGLAATIMIQLVRDGFHQQMPDTASAVVGEPAA